MPNKYIKKIFKEVKKLNNAVEEYTKIGKIPAMPYRAFVNLADYLFLKGSIEQSEELLNNAINFASQSSDAFVNLGVVQQSKNDYEKAIEYYKKALKKDPKNVKALCLWGNCLSFQNNNEDAIKKYERAIEIDKKTSEAYLFWGIVLLKEHKYNEAKEKFESAIKYNPKDARSLFMLGTVEIELGLYDSALEKLMFLIESSDKDIGACHNVAYIHFKKKDYEKAILYALTALSCNPFKIETYLLLGDTYVLVNKIDEAINIYELAENRNLKSLFLYLSWGTALQKNKQYEQAIEKFKQGLELNKNVTNDEIYARLAKCYFILGNKEEAKINAQKAIGISKENYMANKIIADVYIEEKNYTEAIKQLNLCLKNSETKSITFLRLAQCYKHIEDFEQSNQYYEKSLEYDRENIQVMIEYIESLDEQKNYEKATKKLITLEKIAGDKFDVLCLAFKVNYNIAKGNLYGYNGMKAIMLAEKIKTKYPNNFCFDQEYKELTSISREK